MLRRLVVNLNWHLIRIYRHFLPEFLVKPHRTALKMRTLNRLEILNLLRRQGAFRLLEPLYSRHFLRNNYDIVSKVADHIIVILYKGTLLFIES